VERPRDESQDANWTFLWGKRRWRRHAVALRAEIRANGASLPAVVADASAGGALVSVSEQAVLRALGKPERGVLGGLPELLGRGFGIRISSRRVTTTATLVRVTWRQDDPGRLYLGCRFDRPLQARELRRLGLSAAVCGPERGQQARPSSEMALHAPADRPVLLEIRDESRLLLAGPLLAAEGRSVATELSPGDPTEAAARLGRHTLRIVARANDQVLWTDQAYLLAIRAAATAPQAVEIVLLASGPVPYDVTRHLVCRATENARDLVG
jgi:hypothetical protein